MGIEEVYLAQSKHFRFILIYTKLLIFYLSNTKEKNLQPLPQFNFIRAKGKRGQIFDSLSLLLILIIMQKLLRSRRHLQETSEKVGKLSPEKFGQGAFLDLTFTPSKLTEHVLYREATHLKKVQEESSRSRELEVANKVLHDQVEFLKRERDGIQKSLTRMIEMYKQIIAEMQGKSQERIRIIQLKFKQQIQKNIREKEEEAKFIQSQKEVVERHVVQLDARISELISQLQLLGRNKNQVQLDLQQLQAEHKTLKANHEDLLKKSKENQHKMKQEYDDLKEEFLRAEIQWKDKLREELHRKDLQIEKSARLHKVELQKVQNQRNTDSLLKNQQVKQLTKTFESECARMKQILNAKEKMIDNLSQDNNKQKTKIINLTREYENQITHLSHEKNRLLEEIQSFGRENEALAHEKVIVTEELAMENEKLRELLYQSSMELEKCRSELVGLAKDNQKLVTRLKGSEEEAKTWRDSYYLNRTRPS